VRSLCSFGGDWTGKGLEGREEMGRGTDDSSSNGMVGAGKGSSSEVFRLRLTLPGDERAVPVWPGDMISAL
jgi:hypothetical protein